MRTLRSLWRLALLVPFTAVLCLVNALGSRAPKRRARFLHVWARGAVRILGVRVKVSGSPPRPPVLLACNHLGYLDVVVLASRTPGVFVAKSEVAGWPVLGPLVRQMGTIFVERGRRTDLTRVIESMEEAVTNGAGVTFFPEGTSSDGGSVLPFHPSLLEAAARAGFPVFCAGLRYRTRSGDPPAETSVAWWGDMTFAPHFRGLLGLRGIEARVRFASEPVRGDDRKELARVARERVIRARGPAPEDRAP